jgi:7-keto-8-aminopelargonate synthetase-like enzyme
MTSFVEGPPVEPECARAAELAAHLCEDLGHFVEVAAPPTDPAAVRSLLRVIMAAHTRNVVMRRLNAIGREL